MHVLSGEESRKLLTYLDRLCLQVGLEAFPEDAPSLFLRIIIKNWFSLLFLRIGISPWILEFAKQELGDGFCRRRSIG